MGEKDDDDDDDDDEEGAQGPLPESILRTFPDRGPPSPAELEKFRRGFGKVMERNAGIVWNKILEMVPSDTSPEDREDLHASVFTTYFAFAKRLGIPLGEGPALTSTAIYTIKNYLRVRRRATRRVAAVRAEAVFAGVGVEPNAYVRTLLNQILEQFSEQDQRLLLWDAEGNVEQDMAKRLGIPRGTVCSRLRALRKRVLAILEQQREKEPTEK